MKYIIRPLHIGITLSKIVVIMYNYISMLVSKLFSLKSNDGAE